MRRSGARDDPMGALDDRLPCGCCTGSRRLARLIGHTRASSGGTWWPRGSKRKGVVSLPATV
jgi:hypothetical protein